MKFFSAALLGHVFTVNFLMKERTERSVASCNKPLKGILHLKMKILSLITYPHVSAQADIVLLVDSSGSIGESDFEEVRKFLHAFVDRYNLRPDKVRVGLAQFSDIPYQEFLLGDYSDKRDLHHKLNDLIYRRGGPNPGLALTFIRENYFRQARQNVPGIAIVITDGESNDDVEEPSQRLRNLGVSIFVIRMKYISMQQKIRSAIDKWEDAAVVRGNSHVFLTECMFDVVADIAFIVDQSSSIRLNNFQLVRDFLENTIGGLDVGEGKIKIAVVLYSDFPRADVYFNTFDDKTDILRYISSMPYGRGKTYTGAALKFAKEHVFTKGRGSRRDHHVQQVAVVITDGKSTDKVAGAAAALRRSGVTVFALGIKDTEEDDLREIASYPYKKFVFNVKDFDKLNSLSNILTKTLCNEITDSIIPRASQSFALQGW
uniref:Si:ch211-62a1.3 n=1 Tax=Cyprinus carpio TaxID=7962 RepID=A0A8C2JHY4_CYPCA